MRGPLLFNPFSFHLLFVHNNTELEVFKTRAIDVMKPIHILENQKTTLNTEIVTEVLFLDN